MKTPYVTRQQQIKKPIQTQLPKRRTWRSLQDGRGQSCNHHVDNRCTSLCRVITCQGNKRENRSSHRSVKNARTPYACLHTRVHKRNQMKIAGTFQHRVGQFEHDAMRSLQNMCMYMRYLVTATTSDTRPVQIEKTRREQGLFGGKLGNGSPPDTGGCSCCTLVGGHLPPRLH